MKPVGNFIDRFEVYSLNEDIHFIFKANFIGIPTINRVSELKEKSIIAMSRKTYRDHLYADKFHFYTVEEYLEVINNPDFILYMSKVTFGHKVQIITKERDVSKIGVVILYTNNSTGIHLIASGFEISRKKIEAYLKKHKIIWQKDSN